MWPPLTEARVGQRDARFVFYPDYDSRDGFRTNVVTVVSTTEKRGAGHGRRHLFSARVTRMLRGISGTGA